MLNVRQPIESVPQGFTYPEFTEWKLRERIGEAGSNLAIGWQFGPMWLEQLEAHNIACDAYLIAFWQSRVKWSELPVQYKARIVGEEYQEQYKLYWSGCITSAIQRMGFVFYGHQNIDVKNDDYIKSLAPDKIPFHLPALMADHPLAEKPTLEDWFIENRWIVEIAR